MTSEFPVAETVSSTPPSKACLCSMPAPLPFSRGALNAFLYRSCFVNSTTVSRTQGLKRHRTVQPLRTSFVRHNSSTSDSSQWRPGSEFLLYTGTLLALGGGFYVTYKTNEPFRHACLAAVRCSRVARTSITNLYSY